MLKAVDFFCGGGGMSLGLSNSGINILAGIDNNQKVEKTYKANHPESEFILEDISKLSAKFLEKAINIKKNDDNLIFIGCSPCQYWSIVNTNKSSSIKTAFLLEYFQNFVEYFRPGYIVIENVPGLSNKTESPINNFKKSISELGYFIDDAVIDCSDFGVPQKRRRYLLLASRIRKVLLPTPTHTKKITVRDAIQKYPKISSGEKSYNDYFHSTSSLSDTNLQRIQSTPHNGGDRLSWKNNKHLQLKAYQNKDNCFKDVYGRLFWDKPSPTVTTKFISYSNGRFGHPEQNRALSVREGAALQSFPDDYKIISSTIGDAAKIIGNAVPPKLAEAIGNTIKNG
ncbi:MAG: DNA (cytosine-5)-methyltransferase 1 [Colwellia sp.]|jgi:DNA (cytosine-5)-methyltransferase 1